MKVNGISSSNIVNLYNVNKRNVDKKQDAKQNDSIQISRLGKNLSTYSLDDKYVDNTDKIKELKDKIENGTYRPDSRKIAQKMMQGIKEAKSRKL
ncbi:flagellar biosynthesis anti-sigma factor FlgM [Clostridium fermenticellae]|uniref:Negative regulator of flagellin synthesis n=1 Tax=Clostridium fermenticellae TaxID=2068654 RepID=A0A386H4Y1_9CLOT|nr:flagellar biosynthesis anti-sigma factor FlgM [Clostridium fermenticellae]AYD40720.1 flagellar biosynthesis anti-sigma factor FlgM [Clostridium fermenticellae]